MPSDPSRDDKDLTAFATERGIAPATFFTKPEDAAAMARELALSGPPSPRHSSGGGIVRVGGAVTSRWRIPIGSADRAGMPPRAEALGVAVLMNFARNRKCLCLPRSGVSGRGRPSTLRESIWDPALQQRAEDLLASLGWTGVAMVEFKVDPRDGEPKLLEVNPRFWGSLHHAILCGVDFPFLLYRLAVDGDVDRVMRYQVGVRSRSLLHGDMMHFLANPNRCHLTPRLHDFSIPDDVLSADDPLPTQASRPWWHWRATRTARTGVELR
jgi:hypothetical protein